MTSVSSPSLPTLDQPTITVAPDVAPAAPPAAEDRCDVCAHPMSDHDPIAVRYCSATIANALSRACICG